MKKDTAKAILLANLKGPKRKRSPLMTIAQAVRTLKSDRDYRSTHDLAKSFRVSRSIIESFDKIPDHPAEIRKLISDGRILLDTSTKLAAIPNIRRRIELAKEVAGETAFDARYIIDYAKKHPESSARESKSAVISSKDSIRNLHVIVVPLDDTAFQRFRIAAAQRKLTLESAAKIAIEQWLIDGKKLH